MMQIQDWSIRRRIMASVAAAITVMCVCLIITIRLNQQTIEKAGESYKTNAELTAFSMDIAQMEKAMETYVTYRTFESIDAYYHFQSISESECSQFQSKPSTDDILQKEYIVNQITSSFFSCSKKVIAARRANDMTDVSSIYRTCLECYSMLQNEISKLNIMFMQKNAALYNTNRSSFSVLTRTSIVFISVFFLLVFAVLYLSVTSITKPLADISGIALRVANRDFDVPLFNSRSNNEIGNICRAFDRMIISIREYIDTIWEKAKKETELKEKEMEMRELYADAQFRALQNQINPHFLFNTLQALDLEVRRREPDGSEEISTIISDVSDILKYSLSDPQEPVTLVTEILYLKKYVQVQKFRFGDRFIIYYEIDDGVEDAAVFKLLLQPLVENALRYGIQNIEDKAYIRVIVQKQDTMLKFCIEDNGPGMSAQKVAELKKQFGGSPSEHIGLKNVNKRLTLKYGKDAELHIDSQPGSGTQISFTIPYTVYEQYTVRGSKGVKNYENHNI